jgi:hypothetical protein
MNEIVVAANERAFQQVFDGLRDAFTESGSDSGQFGPFTASYDVKFHLENGTIDLRGDNSVKISELDVVWDKLRVSVGLDIPEWCFGGQCILPTPWGCAIRLPRLCAFSDDPDIELPLDLSGVVRSELSASASPDIRYFVDPARAAWMDDVDAATANVSNKWQVMLAVGTVDIDLIDIADTVGDLLDDAIDFAVNDLLGILPDWFRDAVTTVLGSIVDVVRDILDLPDDIQEWISDLLGTSLGLFDFIAQKVAQDLLDGRELLPVADPYPIIGPSAGLIAVSVPVEKFDAFFTDDEMVVTVTVGA